MPRRPLLRHAHITVVERGYSFAFSSLTQWPSILHYLPGEPEESRMKERTENISTKIMELLCGEGRKERPEFTTGMRSHGHIESA